VLAATLFLLATPPAGTSQEAPGAGKAIIPASDPARDCRLTLRARQVLQQDMALTGITHLGVTVRGGVAVVWGSVPSGDVARRAEMLVRQVPGVFDVRNELQVEPPDDPIVQFLQSRPGQVASTPSRQWVSANRPPAVLTARPDEPTPSATPSNGVTLLPPTATTAPTATARADLAARIAAAQQSDPRYLGIVVDVQQGVVRLGGTVMRWEDLFELARAISQLPGVERVILHDVRTPHDRR
jgi:osmotically-inducible protein OsmY